MEGILSFVTRHIHFDNDRQANEIACQKQELLQEINETNEKIQSLRSCFDCQTNFELIDVTIMELRALETKYSYLIRRAKEENLRAF